MADPSEQVNVTRGHKATIHNPRVSEEAKQHSRQVLESLGEPEGRTSHNVGGETTEGKNVDNVARGYKATLSNPTVSDRAKKEAQKKLDEMS